MRILQGEHLSPLGSLVRLSPISGTPTSTQAGVLDTSPSSNGEGQQGEIHGEALPEEDDTLKHKETRMPNITLSVAPQPTIPSQVEMGKQKRLPTALLKKRANAHFALVYSRGLFGLIRDKSGKL